MFCTPATMLIFVRPEALNSARKSGNVRRDKRNGALDCLDELRVVLLFQPRVRQPILYWESVKMYKYL